MMQRRPSLQLLLLALVPALLVVGCSKRSGGGGLLLTTCSLGCSSAAANAPFNCGITDVAVNQEIRLTFNSPIDILSVDSRSFQVVEEGNGKTPPHTFLLDSADPRILIFRPLLTFDSSGNPSFGLTDGATYRVTVPGTGMDAGPDFIRSMSGQPNATRLSCVIVASRGVFDPKPGPPRATVTVTKGGLSVPAQNAFDVDSDSQVVLVFDDLMNPGTLVDPVAMASSTITVAIDPDGDTSDAGDQVEIDGSFTIIVDQFALTTRVVFTPTGLYPSRGMDPANPRKVVVRLPSSIVDLGGNSLVNNGEFAFVPERQDFMPVTLLEDFENTVLEDAARSSSEWGAPSGALKGLDKGPGAGAGSLGDLFLSFGERLVLNTDSEDFSSIVDPGTFDLTTVVDGAVDPMTGGLVDPITDGVFEFTNLTMQAGSQLIFEGSNPVRLYVRGEALVQGDIFALGGNAGLHDSSELMGGAGGAPGPGGGAGGDGGMLPDGTAFVDCCDATPNPGVMLYSDVDGQPGEGIPFPDSISPTDFVGSGPGGPAWPSPADPMFPNMAFPADPMDIGTRADPKMQFDRRAEGNTACKNPISGGGGGGGAHALSGGNGIPKRADVVDGEPRFQGAPAYRLPPVTAGGDSSELSIDDTVKSLDPDAGLLRGGSGGGGGGAHLQSTRTNGRIIFDCHDMGLAASSVTVLGQHSGAGGGAGGGAIQVQAGATFTLNGMIDVSAGAGGSRIDANNLATPGGGGAGGAVLLQAPQLLLSPLPRRIDYNGGAGGVGANGTTGGRGAPGFVRFETITPFSNPAALPTRLDPSPSTLSSVYGEDDFDTVFTVGEWVPRDFGPSGRSGAMSCWMKPAGNFFLLDFAEDGAELGWDMRVLLRNLATPQSWRGPNDVSPNTLEDILGNDLGSSPVVVRFQGARLVAPLGDPCDVELYGPDSVIFPGSLTPWVKHPADLNTMDASMTPNMVRFQVIWDGNEPGYNLVEGVIDITISATPD